MVQYVQWDDEKGFQGVVRHLPPSLAGRDAASLRQLGYRERVVRHPEDFIPRFSALLGSSTFEVLPDGRVLESFPDADFSVEAVRRELISMAKQDAGRELNRTDWYVVRAMELDKPTPKEIKSLRKKVRDHVDWIIEDVNRRSPRELVEYTWKFPTMDSQVMVNGVPVIFNVEPPTPPTPLPEPPEPGFVPEGEAQGVYGNSDPNVLTPPPPPPDEPEFLVPDTTDGPVPVIPLTPGEEHPNFDANNIPLVTVYAPNVDDPGPQPDQQ